MEIDPAEFSSGLDVRSERKRGVKDDYTSSLTVVGASNQKDEVVIKWEKLEQVWSRVLGDLFWMVWDLRCMSDI